MYVSLRSALKGATVVTSAVVALAANTALAQTVTTVNGVDIDNQVFDTYMQNRLQKPLEQVTPDERDFILREITDIYLLSTQERAKELEDTDDIRVTLELQYRALLAQAVAADFFTSNAATEDELFEEYTRVIEREPGMEYKARHILVDTQGKGVELIGELKGGADFQELAKEHSTGPSGPQGGDLGWFGPNTMVAEFSAAVQELEDGKFSEEPVQTQFGWHVILREDSRDREPPTLESIRDQLKQQVEAGKFQVYLEGLRQANGN